MTTSELRKRSIWAARLFPVAAAAALLLASTTAQAAIDGVNGPMFDLTASAGYVSVADGGSIYTWGYAETNRGLMQLPGPTLIVTEGAMVQVKLTNALPTAAGNVSIVFPGHDVTMTSGGVPGLLTREAPRGESVTYTFTASNPGTYQYHSGTRPDLQVEMGLYGALIVRPAAVPADCAVDSAYDHAATCFDREYLFLLSEIDFDIHAAVEAQAGSATPIHVPTEPYIPEYWLINGRTGPDTLIAAGDAQLPTQPYNIVPRMHPGEKTLMRVVGAGHQMHPFHHHGNHARVLARDGRLLLSATDPTKLAGPLLFTIPSVPGGTVDAIWEWTGRDLGWDVYNHQLGDGSSCTDAEDNETGLPGADGYDDVDNGPNDWEWCADHLRPIPVDLPDLSVLTFGGFWSGSPYLGALDSLPPGEGGLNPTAAFTFIWHSHTERELVNNDVFPGGMMTFMFVEAPGTPID